MSARAYYFDDRFESQIVAGLQSGIWEPGMKRQTIRQSASPELCRCKLDLIVLGGGKAARRLATVECCDVRPIQINFDRPAVRFEGAAPLTGRGHLDAFAAMDGFSDFDDMAPWLIERYSNPLIFNGFVVRWTSRLVRGFMPR